MSMPVKRKMKVGRLMVDVGMITLELEDTVGNTAFCPGEVERILKSGRGAGEVGE